MAAKAKKKPAKTPGEATIAVNRRARHDFEIGERFEAGLVLLGSEVKSLRAGKANLRDSYARMQSRELWLHNAHISPYDPASQFGHDPLRERKLLLNRQEIYKLDSKVKERGLTLIPLRLYFKKGRAKVEIGVAKGKKRHDKRDSLREREAAREVDRAMKRR